MKSFLAQFVALTLMLFLVDAGLASAQTFPQRPVHLVVGYSSGSGVDIVGRVLAEHLASIWGQPVIVENRPGAAGNVAAELVARAPADGYTLLLVTGSHAINPSLYPHLPFDTKKDFSPISLISSSPLILVVGPAVHARTVNELVAEPKSSKSRLNYASAGNGNLTHLAAELFKSEAGVDMVHIPYKGGAPAITDVLAGRVALYFSGLPPALPLIAAGKLRALAVTTTARSPAAPNVPTMAEAGVPGYDIDLWYGMVGPAKMPQELVRKINADVATALAAPDLVRRFKDLGVTPNPTRPKRSTQ